MKLATPTPVNIEHTLEVIRRCSFADSLTELELVQTAEAVQTTVVNSPAKCFAIGELEDLGYDHQERAELWEAVNRDWNYTLRLS